MRRLDETLNLEMLPLPTQVGCASNLRLDPTFLPLALTIEWMSTHVVDLAVTQFVFMVPSSFFRIWRCCPL